jgi:hypothetical protein
MQSVSAKEFCTHHQIEFSFIHSLHEYGLIECDASEKDYFLPQDQLERLEQLVRLHYDLHINLEGLDAIHHLLERIESMQRDIAALQNRLRLYEGN